MIEPYTRRSAAKRLGVGDALGAACDALHPAELVLRLLQSGLRLTGLRRGLIPEALRRSSLEIRALCRLPGFWVYIGLTESSSECIAAVLGLGL